MTTYDPALCERLEGEARLYSVSALTAKWVNEKHTGRDDDPNCIACEIRNEIEEGECKATEDAQALLHAMSDQLEAARAEVDRLTEELGHATSHDGDWLSKTSRAMCETLVGDRDALRAKVRELTDERDALRAEVERMRPVVNAAELWRFRQTPLDATDLDMKLADAIDAYRDHGTAGKEGE